MGAAAVTAADLAVDRSYSLEIVERLDRGDDASAGNVVVARDTDFRGLAAETVRASTARKAGQPSRVEKSNAGPFSSPTVGRETAAATGVAGAPGAPPVKLVAERDPVHLGV